MVLADIIAKIRCNCFPSITSLTEEEIQFLSTYVECPNGGIACSDELEPGQCARCLRDMIIWTDWSGYLLEDMPF